MANELSRYTLNHVADAARVVGTIAVAVSAIAVLAQGPNAEVTVAIQPSTLVRGRTVPRRRAGGYSRRAFHTRRNARRAERRVAAADRTRGFSRALPTYPIPDFVRLPGASVPVLAYSGTVTIRVPLRSRPASRAGGSSASAFDYQLCDAASCAAVRTKTATIRVTVDEPAATDASLAFRIDASRVAIVTDVRQARPDDQGLDFITPAARYALRMAPLPQDHEARAQLDEPFSIGSHWTVLSNGRQFDAVADSAGGFSVGLRTDAAHADCANRQRVVPERSGEILSGAPGRRLESRLPMRSSLDIDVDLTAAERRELEALLDHQLRMTLPTITAPDPVLARTLSAAEAQPAETTYDRGIREGNARLVYHVEAFKLAPDGDARLYVRAHWVMGAMAERGVTLWIRHAAGRAFQVERSDAAVSRLAPYLVKKDVGTDSAARPEFAGTLLNVIPSPDGWAYVVMGRRGYESFGVSVWKYSPAGPLDTGIGYGYGC